MKRIRNKTLVDVRRELLFYRRITPSGCWEWTRCISVPGYGKIGYRKAVYRVHRMSAKTFMGLPLNSKKCVLHKCDNRICYNPKHLFIGTVAENQQDMVRKGRSTFGVRNPMAKLSPQNVRQIRELRRAGLTQAQLAANFGVCRGTIHNVLHKKCWKSI